MDWFLYDDGLRHERVKQKMKRRQILQKLVYEKFYIHEKFLGTQNCRRKFFKNLLPEKHKQLRFKSRLKKSLPRKYQQIIW